jgi:hypothetical protein
LKNVECLEDVEAFRKFWICQRVGEGILTFLGQPIEPISELYSSWFGNLPKAAEAL